MRSTEVQDLTAVLMAIAIGGLTSVLYLRVVADLLSEWWNSPAWSHGLLALPLAGALMCSERKSLTSGTVELRGLFLIAAACLACIVGRLGAEYYVQRLSLVLLLAGLLWTFAGRAVLLRFAFPLSIVAICIPLPRLIYNAAAAPLQLFATDLATRAAQFWGTAVHRQGNIIYLSDISLGVEEACSGLHSMSALLLGALVLGHWCLRGWAGQIVLCLAVIPVAVFVNVLRVAGTAILSDADRSFAMGFYHSFSGWLTTVAGCLLLLASARVLETLQILRARQT